MHDCDVSGFVIIHMYQLGNNLRLTAPSQKVGLGRPGIDEVVQKLCRTHFCKLSGKHRASDFKNTQQYTDFIRIICKQLLYKTGQCTVHHHDPEITVGRHEPPSTSIFCNFYMEPFIYPTSVYLSLPRFSILTLKRLVSTATVTSPAFNAPGLLHPLVSPQCQTALSH